MNLLSILLQAAIAYSGSKGNIGFITILIVVIIVVAALFLLLRNNKKTASVTETRYPAMRTIALVYEILAYSVGVIAFVVAVYFAYNAGDNTISYIIIIASIFIGALLTLSLLLISESIKVLVDIEQNTRETAKK